MAERCTTAAVLGAGVMGSAIAAHLAGAGIKTHLLDIVVDPQNRDKLAQEAIAKQLKSRPAAFYDNDAARLIVPGNLEDHLERLRDCDLVIEAVVERLDIKKNIFAKMGPYLSSTAIVASNTSGLSVAELNAALPANLQQNFVIMHFFNPVRYMRLLEIVSGPKTRPEILTRAAAIGETLGKGIVIGKDTPNFVANRIGVYGIAKIAHIMLEQGLTVEEVDKIAGTPMGRPKSAVFRTADLVGIDTLIHVAQNCYDNLSKDDEREIFKLPSVFYKLVEHKRLGEKTGQGFYKKVGSDILVLDFETFEYRPQNKVRFDVLGAIKGIEDVRERTKMLVSSPDKAGVFAWKALANVLAYSAKRVGEIADDIVSIDKAMCWGFNWDLGPFETWDAIGVVQSVERMHKEGIGVPKWVTDMIDRGQTSFYQGSPSEKLYFDVANKSHKPVPRNSKQVSLEIIKDSGGRVVKSNMGASLVDIGDGCLCFEVHTKMNTIDADVIGLMQEAVSIAEKDFEALVIGNDGEHFGAGANLMLVLMSAQQQQWAEIETMVTEFQRTMQMLRYAKIPVVAAPFNYTFGGAAEISMACDAIQAHAETYMGLVEVGAGLVPAGGGCLRLVERFTELVQDIEGADLLPFIGQASINIATAKVSTSGEEARRLRFLKATDGVSLNRSELLHHAKERALGLARSGYRAPRPRLLKAAGFDAAKTIGMRVWSMMEGKYASEHDGLIAKHVARIVCGGDVAAGTERTEQHYLDLEKEAFLSLCGQEKSQARMQSILLNNKPLRN
jgi:3-hydroxyacyl-CoA dehydrogenase